MLEATAVPVIVRGPGAGPKQNQVLARVAEEFQGEGLVLHSASQEDYKTLAAVAVAYGHVLVAESPIDMNIAKQLDILLADSSVDLNRVLIDPLTGALGYGLEYTYSVMQRIRLAALGGDAMLNCPLICLAGDEAWKAKEARAAGSAERRASTGRWPPPCRSSKPARRWWCCAIPRRWRASPGNWTLGFRAEVHHADDRPANFQAAAQHQLPQVRLPHLPGVRHEAGGGEGIARKVPGRFRHRRARR